MSYLLLKNKKSIDFLSLTNSGCYGREQFNATILDMNLMSKQ